MIKSISVTNDRNDTLFMELKKPEDSGLAVLKVKGLGPAKASINMTEFAVGDGGVFNSARALKRNILLTLLMLEKPSIEDTRQLTYKYFPIKSRIKLVIETDNRVVETYGYVESNEPNIFSKAESTVISILCDDPYLESAATYSNTLSVETPTFTFPFEGGDIIFGTISDSTFATIDYDGDEKIGVELDVTMSDVVTHPLLYNSNTREFIKIDTDILTTITGSGFVNGDFVKISTIRNKKSIKLIRAGLEINILNCLTVDSSWMQLDFGDNVFAYSAVSGYENMEVTLRYKVKYEGV